MLPSGGQALSHLCGRGHGQVHPHRGTPGATWPSVGHMLGNGTQGKALPGISALMGDVGSACLAVTD